MINTDNGSIVQLGTAANIGSLVNPTMTHPTMNSAGNEFLYTFVAPNDTYQLAIAELNPASLGDDPSVSNVTISPSYLLTRTRSAITVSAAVTASSTPVGVSESFELNGVAELEEFSDDPLNATGDGTYTNDDITTESTQTGPRDLRISAETVDASGLQHVTMVDVSGLTVVNQAPAASLQFSSPTYSVSSSSGTATITVTRSINTVGTATVHYATSNGTAVAGTDYTATSGTLSFAAGQASQSFTIPILDNPEAAAAATVILTLSTPSSGADLGSQSTATLTITAPLVVHTITYNQIGTLPSNQALNADSPYNILSANGNRAVIETTGPGGTQIDTINSDGSGLTTVDSNPGTVDQLDISADGSVVLERIEHGNAGDEFRVVNADGSDMHDAFDTETYSTGIADILSADGSTVFFEDDASFTVNNTTYAAGLYSVAAAGGEAPELIASQSQVAAVAGLPVSDVVMIPEEGFDLSASADGTQLVFAASQNGVGDFLLGVNSDGTDLHTIGPLAQSSDGISEAGISGDGTTVFRYDSGDAFPNGPVLTVYNFDGSGEVTLNVPSGLGADTGGPEQVELNQDGSELLLGSGALLINTDNGSIVQLGTAANIGSLVNPTMTHPTMNSAGNEFLYTFVAPNDTYQLAIAELNPASLGDDPSVSNVTISPSYLLTQTRSAITVSAAVTASSTPVGVSESFELNGVAELEEFSDDPLNATGDGTYTNDDITTESTQTGPRDLRISAETVQRQRLAARHHGRRERVNCRQPGSASRDDHQRNEWDATECERRRRVRHAAQCHRPGPVRRTTCWSERHVRGAVHGRQRHI